MDQQQHLPLLGKMIYLIQKIKTFLSSYLLNQALQTYNANSI